MFHDVKRPGIVPDTAIASPMYDASCRRCVRLATFLDEVRAAHPTYRCLPVPPFGDPDARLIIVGLAPGLHGANATGRPFTGDFAGILLYETLHAYGYASSPVSRTQDDPLTLARLPDHECGEVPSARTTSRCPAKCAIATITSPPISRCCRRAARCWRSAASRTMRRCWHSACAAIISPSGMRRAIRSSNGRALFDSYHCSRYNTNTGRLTPAMFRTVFDAIGGHLGRTRP